MQYPGTIYYWMYLTSDTRKKFYVNINPELGFGNEHYSRSTYLSASLTYRPLNALNISVSPSLSHNEYQMQYVTTATVNNETRYVVSKIDQTTARITIRATYMITPNLSVQYYGQPFGTTGRYSDFKYVQDADAREYTDRFMKLPADWVSLSNGEYAVDENDDDVAEFKFSNPNFNFGQFRSNMVIRWEYIPGSTLFFVWTQELNGAFSERGDEPVHQRYAFNFDQKAHNIFLMKFTYRFVL
jgi:hypothetical protein